MSGFLSVYVLLRGSYIPPKKLNIGMLHLFIMASFWPQFYGNEVNEIIRMKSVYDCMFTFVLKDLLCLFLPPSHMSMSTDTQIYACVVSEGS